MINVLQNRICEQMELFRLFSEKNKETKYRFNGISYRVHHFRIYGKYWHNRIFSTEIFQHSTCLTSTQMSINQAIIQCRELCDEMIVQDFILFEAISNILVGDLELMNKLQKDLECLVNLIKCIYMPGFFWNGFTCNGGASGAVITDSQRVSTYWSPEHYPTMFTQMLQSLETFPYFLEQEQLIQELVNATMNNRRNNSNRITEYLELFELSKVIHRWASKNESKSILTDKAFLGTKYLLKQEVKGIKRKQDEIQ